MLHDDLLSDDFACVITDDLMQLLGGFMASDTQPKLAIDLQATPSERRRFLTFLVEGQ